MSTTLAQVALAILAIYHLASGGLALLAPRYARRFVRSLYAAEVGESAQIDYMIAMIGAQAVALGLLAAIGATAPLEHRAVLAAIALLQLLRAAVRVARRDLLGSALRVPGSRNAIAVALLLGESAILLAALA